MMNSTVNWLKQSPLVLFTGVGALGGLLLGVANTLLPSYPESTVRIFPTEVSERQLTAEPEKLLWRPVHELSTEQANERPLKTPYAWNPVIYLALSSRDFDSVFGVISKIRDHEEKAIALRQIAMWVAQGSKQLNDVGNSILDPDKTPLAPATGYSGYNLSSPKEEPKDQLEKRRNDYKLAKKKHEADVQEFQSLAVAQVSRAVEVATALDDSREKVFTLASLAQSRFLADSNQREADRIRRTAGDSVAALEIAQGDKQAREATQRKFSVVIHWVGALAIGGLTLASFGKVCSFYLVRYMVRLIGDEDLAQHLGATIRTVKKSALILPNES